MVLTVCSQVRLTKDKDDRPSGRAFVDFEYDDKDKALAYNQDHIGDRYAACPGPDSRASALRGWQRQWRG